MGNCFKKTEKPEKPKPTEEEGATPATPESTGDNFALQLLKAQNEYRKLHGAEPLTLDTNLCEEAQKWANKLAEMGKLQHADIDDGENLASASPELSAQRAADMWYNEIENYDFKNPGFKSGTGHFTQVVWVGSKQFGGAIAEGKNGMYYAVGRYRPAGNITNPGYFEKNVYPKK